MKGGAHQVRALGAELEQELIQLRGSSCDKHKGEQVKLYCYALSTRWCEKFAIFDRNTRLSGKQYESTHGYYESLIMMS